MIRKILYEPLAEQVKMPLYSYIIHRKVGRTVIKDHLNSCWSLYLRKQGQE
ncbi:MAG: hypothetical protein AB1478_00305 [Nitrospirota bacterium]